MARNPSIIPTTLWDFPSQNYGKGSQGDSSYTGATPSYIVWNLLSRYTRKGDTVLDPFCGSGTTLDVAADLGREAVGYDLCPARKDISIGDARQLPLKDNSVDFIFMDPPYGDHIHYSDDDNCLGRISAFDDSFFTELGRAAAEAGRVLRRNRYLGLYICDFYKHGRGFVPVGFKAHEVFSKHFETTDVIAVTRHNSDLNKGNYRKAAVDQNFFLRGFNYLFIYRKKK